MSLTISQTTSPYTTLQEQADEALAQLARQDYAAFAALYRRYVTRVYRYCYSQTGNGQDAEDCTSQTFLAALEQIGRFRGQGSFAAWLFGIARRRCQDVGRRQARRQEVDQPPEMVDTAFEELVGLSYRQELLGCVERRLRTMTADRQEVLRLRFWAGLSTKETARVMRKGESAVKMLLARAVADLRERCLDET